ncbi:predicted protein [Naegleria gruberi]|uniref:Predicted protein n=1 Tax=Naegleria gruberi TaxID=5762 RepID=D2V422_NAEGR|nr:uncharacterized protein NAEGRDRAFT_63568 [Naegleria gruberi]EFC48301.1 predicted protein [Naegleria gruberi]|eukprot:XP_002681045.1 predicted protein [Naegleria gruberi strain NEG-M]
MCNKALGISTIVVGNLTNPFGLSITNQSLLVANTIGQTILYVDLNNYFNYSVIVGVKDVAGFNGDGQLTYLNITLANPQKAFKYNSLIYVADTWNQRIRVIDGNFMYTLIGDGECGDSKNGNDLKSFQLCNPTDIFVLDDIIYICDSNNHKIRKIQNGTVETICGNGDNGFNGDDIKAVDASLNEPQSIYVTRNTKGTDHILYIADTSNHRIRKVENGIISTICGNGESKYNGDLIPAKEASLNNPKSVLVTSVGEVYFRFFK